MIYLLFFSEHFCYFYSDHNLLVVQIQSCKSGEIYVEAVVFYV